MTGGLHSAPPPAQVDPQVEYRTWLDSLPANLEGSGLADKLQAIVDFDLDELRAKQCGLAAARASGDYDKSIQIKGPTV